MILKVLSCVLGKSMTRLRILQPVVFSYHYSDMKIGIQNGQKKQGRNVFSPKPVEICFNFKEVIQYISKNKYINDQQFQSLCQKAYNTMFQSESWQNYAPFNNKINQLNVKKCSISLLAYICGIAHILSQHTSFDLVTYPKIMEHVLQQLNNPNQQITDDQLVMFLNAANLLNRKQVIDKISSLLLQRIQTMSIYSKIKYIQVMSRVKFPTKQSRRTYSEIVKNLDKSLFKQSTKKGQDESFSRLSKQIELKYLILIYLNTISINPKIFSNILNKKVERLIKYRIGEFNLQDLSLIFSAYNSNNVFYDLLFDKAINQISIDEKAEIQAKVIFKIISKICIKYVYQLNTTPILKKGSEAETKLMRFLQKNLNQSSQIIGILRSNLLSKQQIRTLNQYIINSQYLEQYKSKIGYIYQVVERDMEDMYGNSPQSCSSFWKDILLQEKQHHYQPKSTNRYISYVLILENLYKKHKNQSNWEWLIELKEFTQNQIKQAITDPTFRLKIKRDDAYENMLREQFYKVYGSIIIQKLMNNQISDLSKIQVNKNIFTYRQGNLIDFFLINLLISVNDQSNMAKLLQSIQDRYEKAQVKGKQQLNLISMNKIKSLVTIVMNNPVKYRRCYNTFNSLLIHMIKELQRIKNIKGNIVNANKRASLCRTLMLYICSWQTHQCLSQKQVPKFMHLIRVLIKCQQSIFALKVNELITYLSDSPNKYIRNSPEYIQILKELAKKYVAFVRLDLGRKYAGVDKHSKRDPVVSAHKNDYSGSHQFGFFFLDVQLMNYNLMSPQYAKVAQKNINSSLIKSYISTLMPPYKIDLKSLKISPTYLPIICKSRTLSQQQLHQYSMEIMKSIEMFSCDSEVQLSKRVQVLEHAIINFEMDVNKYSVMILNGLLSKYIQYIQKNTVSRPYVLLMHLKELLSPKTHPNPIYKLFQIKYEQLLSKLSKLSKKNITQYPLCYHFNLILECRNKDIEVASYAEKVLDELLVSINTASQDSIQDMIVFLDILEPSFNSEQTHLRQKALIIKQRIANLTPGYGNILQNYYSSCFQQEKTHTITHSSSNEQNHETNEYSSLSVNQLQTTTNRHRNKYTY